uniref:transposase n=1 Tax=Atlanticothrix silvestris TaxID=2840444 RepID=UPI00384BA42E
MDTDEIALVKGHGNYCVVLIDLDTFKVIAILSDRRQDTIRKFLVEWGIEVLEQIEGLIKFNESLN